MQEEMERLKAKLKPTIAPQALNMPKLQQTERNVTRPMTNSSSHQELPAQATAEFAPGIMNQPTIDSYQKRLELGQVETLGVYNNQFN